MKSSLIFSVLILVSLMTFGQKSDFQRIVLENEENPQNLITAKQFCFENNYPVSIQIKNKGLIELITVVDQLPVYIFKKNSSHPIKEAQFLSYSQVQSLVKDKTTNIYFGNNIRQKNYNVYEQISPKNTKDLETVLLISESTSDHIMTFDPETGDLIGSEFYNLGSAPTGTPVEPNITNDGNLVFSDQLADALLEFNPLGEYIDYFAPNTGPNNDILDNIRGFWIDDSWNYYITVGSGANSDAVAKFDADGNFLENFIEPNATVMDSPFDILFRSSDVLVNAITTNAVVRYDLSGNYIDNFVNSITFPEQSFEDDDGRIIIAGFSGESGVYIYESDGTLVKYLNCISGTRGVYMLGNGHILATNGSGVHEIDTVANTIVRTVISGVSARFISEITVEDINWPENNFIANGETEFCDDVVLLSTTDNSFLSYEWLVNETTIPDETSFEFTADTTGNYQVVISFYNIWSDTSEIINVTENFENITIQQNGVLLSVPDNYTAYQWYLNDEAIAGATSNTYTATENGMYYAEVTTVPDCIVITNTVEVTSVSLNNILNKFDFEICPNPNNGIFKLKSTKNGIVINKVVITDIYGKELIHFMNIKNEDTYTINLNNISDGIYLIKLIDNYNTVKTKKLIITK